MDSRAVFLCRCRSVTFEEARDRLRAGWYVDQQLLCKANPAVNNTPPNRCGKVSPMSETTKEIPLWVGGESGQRKRYLRSLEKELAAELGPDWREKIAHASS